MNTKAVNRIIKLIIFFAAGLSSFSGITLAEERPDDKFKVRLCTGPKNQSYEELGKVLKDSVNNLQGTNPISIELVETFGGQDNIQKVEKGECDMGMALSAMVKGKDFTVVAKAQTAYGHLVCLRSAEVSDLDDIAKKNIPVAAGHPLSTGHATFRQMQTLEPDYKNIPIQPTGINDAIAKMLSPSPTVKCAFAMPIKGKSQVKAKK